MERMGWNTGADIVAQIPSHRETEDFTQRPIERGQAINLHSYADDSTYISIPFDNLDSVETLSVDFSLFVTTKWRKNWLLILGTKTQNNALWQTWFFSN